MSGHSKWANIKHRKSAQDAKKGKVFGRCVKAIIVAARHGGGDVSMNAALKTAIEKAKEVNVPNDNIERAIKRGTGEIDGANYEEIVYEGYGPAGTAIMVEVLTDNRNRTAGEIRHIFSKSGGNMGESGSVGWMFEKKGEIIIPAESIDEESLIEKALDAGADDVITESDGSFTIYTDPKQLHTVKDALEKAKIPIEDAQVMMKPKNSVTVGEKDAPKVLRIYDALEEHDDVQNVYANFEISDEILEKISV